MYNIEKTSFGLKLTLSDFVRKEDIDNYKNELDNLLRMLPDKFGILIDMRALKPLAPEAQESLTKTQKLVGPRLTRSATIIDSAILNMQFKRLSKKSGVITSKRFIDASKVDNWEQAAVNWIVDGLDPDSI